jgi:hypothetical protein
MVHEGGASVHEIAAALGLTSPAISIWLRKTPGPEKVDLGEKKPLREKGHSPPEAKATGGPSPAASEPWPAASESRPMASAGADGKSLASKDTPAISEAAYSRPPTLTKSDDRPKAMDEPPLKEETKTDWLRLRIDGREIEISRLDFWRLLQPG